jgi:flagellar basal-body rod protein FlgF
LFSAIFYLIALSVSCVHIGLPRMDALTSTAASGLRSRMESLDVLANNLANTETGGYKSDREFYNLYVAPEAQADPQLTMPVVESAWTDFSQGALRTTGGPLDLALSGKGFFSVDAPGGPLYTRQGSFQLSPAGVLVTSDGYPVRLSGGGPLQSQSGANFEVAPDGTVSQQGQVLGKLDLVSFPGQNALLKRGNTYFRPADPSVLPVPATAVEVQQGKLETSNVGTAESAVRLVSVMRQFEMLHKAVSIGDDMNKKAVEEVARIGS